MEIKCPACRKLNNTVYECSRCGGDLSALHRVQAAAGRELEKGRLCLKTNHAAEALAKAQVSWRLKKTASAAKLAFLACLFLNRFDEATRWYALALASTD